MPTGDLAATTELRSELGQIEQRRGLSVSWSDAVIRAQVLHEIGRHDEAVRLISYGIDHMPSTDARASADLALDLAADHGVARTYALMVLAEAITAGPDPSRAEALLDEAELLALDQETRPALMEISRARQELANSVGTDPEPHRQRGLAIARELGYVVDVARFDASG